jgi:hypothetical protein
MEKKRKDGFSLKGQTENDHRAGSNGGQVFECLSFQLKP